MCHTVKMFTQKSRESTCPSRRSMRRVTTTGNSSTARRSCSSALSWLPSAADSSASARLPALLPSAGPVLAHGAVRQQAEVQIDSDMHYVDACVSRLSDTCNVRTGASLWPCSTCALLLPPERRQREREREVGQHLDAAAPVIGGASAAIRDLGAPLRREARQPGVGPRTQRQVVDQEQGAQGVAARVQRQQQLARLQRRTVQPPPAQVLTAARSGAASAGSASACQS